MWRWHREGVSRRTIATRLGKNPGTIHGIILESGGIPPRHRAQPDPLHDKTPGAVPARRPLFTAQDFTYDAAAWTCRCPAGKALYRKGQAIVTRGYIAEHFRGTKRDCVPCALRAQCLRTPATTVVRNVAFFRGPAQPPPRDHVAEMKARIDSPDGRALYDVRFATVEPVFANLRANKRLDRFTPRGRAKVDAQWQRYCLVHNIEKLAKAGYAA